MVWRLPGVESARVGIIIIVTHLIGLGSFHYIIADRTKCFPARYRTTVIGRIHYALFLVHLAGQYHRRDFAGRIPWPSQVVASKE
jgi:hypothetical protein